MWFLAYFLIHFFVYTLVRVQFLVWNWSSLRILTISDIFLAFLNGTRFDLSVMALSVGLCFLGLIWMAPAQFFRKIWVAGFVLFNIFLLSISCLDTELYNFTAKRFSKSSFVLFGEGGLSNLFFPYIPLVSFSVLLLAGYAYGAYKCGIRCKLQGDFKKKFFLSAGLVLISVLASRGGLQLKPLSYVDAKIFNSSHANSLVLNSGFTFLKSFTKTSLQRLHYYDREQMLSLLNPQETYSTPSKPNKINVVIFILEGFSKEYLELKNPEPAPFLNQLALKSVNFKNSYANGRRSIEGVAAILSGIPALMEEPFISSEFSANQIIGLGSILSSQKYHTSFFHGANNGSMHFDTFTKSVGVENYFGLNQYPNKEDFDGVWGIYDEPYLQWVCGQLTQFSQPFFSNIFTLSSHQPYSVPEKYKNRFKDERLPILKTIQYTDYALQEFMKCAEKQAWFSNTLFIFTADHTGPELKPNSSFKSRFEVPLIFYSGNKELLKALKAEQFAQHIDILPTLLDILGIEYKNKNFLAQSLLSSAPKFISLFSDNNYELVGQVKNGEQQLKAVQQYFSEGLYDNRLYYPSK